MCASTQNIRSRRKHRGNVEEAEPDPPGARRGRRLDHGRARTKAGHNMDLGRLSVLLNKTRSFTRMKDFGME